MPPTNPDPVAMAAVGRRIHHWRVRRGLTQERLAELVGLRQGSISNYERGRRELLISIALRICEALDIPLGELLPSQSDSDDVVIVRRSRLGRAIVGLQARPDLLEALARED